MSLFCINTPEGRHRKKVRYLVYNVNAFGENVQKLFELSADCLSDDAPLQPALFQRKSPVPKMGRQTYRMWKAMLELSTGLVFKSDLLDKPKTLHFFPLEHFPRAVTSGFLLPGFDLMHFLVHFLRTYFPGLNVVFEDLHDINNHDLNLVSRFHSKTKKKQFLVSDLYAKLHQFTNTPRRDFILGFTWTDLYPKEQLNFVLGEASFQHRCAVLSFGRHEPQSHKEKDEGCEEPFDRDVEGENEEESIVVDGNLLWKLLRVATHETSHLFGLDHCVFFECSMNESKSVAEALAQPLVLCPVCLRKMQCFLKFDVEDRYRNLLDVCQMLQDVYPSDGMAKTVHWLHRCLEFLS